MAGRIEIDLFSTLDGVMQAPGGPEEDPSGGFGFGGWQAPMNDDEARTSLVGPRARFPRRVIWPEAVVG